MSTKHKIIYLLGGAFAVLIYSQACSPIVAFDASEAGESSKVGTSGNPVPSPTPSSTPTASPSPMPTNDVDLGSTCQQKKANGQTRIYSEQINFIEETRTCDFGVGDNLSQLNGYIRARRDQVKNLNLPAGAVVCDVQMTHRASSTFRYDDNVFLTLNGYILASTSNFNRHLTSSTSASGKRFYKYDWLRLRNQDAQNGAADTTADKQYCAGTFCQFPVTESTGTISLNLGSAAIQGIMSITNVNQVSLSAITTGDNDPATDCIHEPIVLDISVEYY